MLLIAFFAAYLVDVREVLTVSTRRVLGVPFPPFRYLAPLLTVWGFSILLMIFMKDLGTSLLFFGALLALIYVATGPVLLRGRRGGAVPDRGDRAVLRLRARADPGGYLAESLGGPQRQGLSDRAVPVLAGLGRAVRPGAGAGVSHPAVGQPDHPAPGVRLHLLGHRRGAGAGGGIGIILLYLIFTYRGLRVAMQSRDDFSRLLATGLTSIFALQAFIIIGGVIKLIPLTGITLPFVSYGGSSVVANFVLLALLLRVSDRAASGKAGGRG